MIVAPDPCPGATLLRLCGGEARAACPTVVEAAAAIGDDALSRCTPDAALLAPADVLFEDLALGPSQRSLERARLVYLAAARAPSVRNVALYRSARVSARMERYADMIAPLRDLLDSAPTPTLVSAAHELYARAILTDDWNQNRIRDGDEGLAEFDIARFRAPLLPDAPWAYDVALFTLRAGFEWSNDIESLIEMVAETRRRWGARAERDSAELDKLLAGRLQWVQRWSQLAPHLFASTERCRARGAPCEAAMIEWTHNFIVDRLSECRSHPQFPPPNGQNRRSREADRALHERFEIQRTAECETAVGWARQWNATHPTPTLELDAVDMSAWVAAMRARASLPRRKYRSAPLPPNPVLRTHARCAGCRATTEPSTGEIEWDGLIDSRRVAESVDLEALRSCAPLSGGAVDVSLVIDESGAVRSASSSVRSATTDCLSGVLRQTRVPIGSEGGYATVRGVVLFGPGARPPRRRTD